MSQISTFRILANVAAAASGDFDSGGTASLNTDVRLAGGTGADQADRVAFDQSTLATSATDNIDLQTTTFTPGGAALGLVELRAFAIKADSNNEDNIEVSPGSSNGFTSILADASDKLIVAPGTTVVLVCPKDGKYPVSGTNKVISVTNASSSATATYSLLLVGTSA